MRWLAFLLPLLAFAAPAARADDVVTVIVKKQDDKQAARWSLTDWLETRDKMRLMDLWLALHSPSPYEFYFGASSAFAQASPGSHFQEWNGEFAAYASIFGVSIEREVELTERYTGLFNLRVFGFNDQATNITLSIGLRHQNDFVSSYRSAIAGGGMTLYFNKFLGIHGLYRHYFDSTADDLGLAHSGNRWQGELFIDFRALRLSAEYYTESETIGGAPGVGRSGPGLGARFYF
jgi:hypothetical protein